MERLRWHPRVNTTHDKFRRFLSSPQTVAPISHHHFAEITRPVEPPTPVPEAPSMTIVLKLTANTPAALDAALPLLPGMLEGTTVHVSHAIPVSTNILPDEVQEQLQAPEDGSKGTREMLERIGRESTVGQTYLFLKESGGTASIKDVESAIGVPVTSLLIPGVFTLTGDGKLHCPHVEVLARLDSHGGDLAAGD